MQSGKNFSNCSRCVKPIEILDLECVLCDVIGVQNENKAFDNICFKNLSYRRVNLGFEKDFQSKASAQVHVIF